MNIQKLWPKVRRLEDAANAGGSGYVEPGKVYTYDGKAADIVQIQFGAVMWPYACIATNAPRLTTMVRAVATGTNGGTEEVTPEEILLETLDDGREVASYKLGGYFEIVFAVWDAGRLYAFSDEAAGYLSLIEFAETIHTIDPKFLPEMGGSSAKKTVLFSGTPQKIDSGSLGTLYVLSADNLLEATEGQDIYGELVIGGVTHSFVLNLYGEMSYTKYRMVTGGMFTLDANLGVPTVAYISGLGGTGFGFIDVMNGSGIDLGEISLTLWTEMGGDKPYYITSLSLDDGTIPYINVSNAKEAFQRDALYYRDNDNHVGRAVGVEYSTDGFNAGFFIPQGGGLTFVSVTADNNGVKASTSIVGTT